PEPPSVRSCPTREADPRGRRASWTALRSAFPGRAALARTARSPPRGRRRPDGERSGIARGSFFPRGPMVCSGLPVEREPRVTQYAQELQDRTSSTRAALDVATYLVDNDRTAWRPGPPPVAREESSMSQPFIGEIRMFGGNFAPAGWALCQGQLQPISQNDTLFNLIGTTYGGDGQETFALPDLQGRAPMHM